MFSHETPGILIAERIVITELSDEEREQPLPDFASIRGSTLVTGIFAFAIVGACVATAVAVFPHVEVFYCPFASAIMVGSREPLAGRPIMGQQVYRALPGRSDVWMPGIEHESVSGGGDG